MPRRAGYPWTEQMSRKLSRNVLKTRSSRSQTAAYARRDRKQAFLSVTSSPSLRVTQPSRLISHLHASYCRRPEMGSFSGSIPPSFVLSYNMPTINTTSNWLCSGAFRSLPALCFRFTGHSSLATRHPPHDLRGPPSMPRAEPGRHPPHGGANMLRHATFSASGRSSASQVFVAS